MTAELTTVEIWERQPGETRHMFAGFQAWLRAQHPRTIVAAWKSYAPARDLDPDGEPAAHFYRWARVHRWAERAQAYEDHLWKLELAARTDAQRRVSGLLTEHAEALVSAAIREALDGNAPLLRDLLDRVAGVGMARSRAPLERAPVTNNTTNTSYAQVNLDLSGVGATELIELARALGPLLPHE